MMNRRYLLVSAVLLLDLGFFLLVRSPARAQGVQTDLRINEVLTSNESTPPVDAENQFEDMVEIYNPSDADIRLQNLIITDTVTKDASGKLHPGGTPWKFLFGSILAKNFILVYCDNDVGTGGNGEPHTPFKLDQAGGIVALFGPGDVLIDLVAVPRLAKGTSYGRYPDGSESFCDMAVPSFKNCTIMAGGCPIPVNKPCANIPPEINLNAHDSIADSMGANPAPGAVVPLVAEVWDEKDNTTSIAKVSILYRVGGGEEIEAPMAMDLDATSKIMKTDFAGDPTGATLIQEKNRSIWKGEIPGQPLGSVVTFIVKVVDAEGAAGTDPKVICAGSPTPGCLTPYRYVVGYSYEGPLVLNEVTPWNTRIILDTTDSKYEDYIEIYSSVDLNLAGLWLSTDAFRPDEWKFPVGSNIKAGGHLIIWCDGDSGKPQTGLYHTSFNLSKEGKVIYIFDTVANGMGMVDGLKYGPAKENVAFSRCPDGLRTSPFVDEKMGSPTKPNSPDICVTPEVKFVRGDADDDGGITINDPIFTLTFMYLAGDAPHCMRTADADGTGLIDITDPVYILAYLYFAGYDPPLPFPACGVDTAPGDLTCDRYDSCLPPP